MPPLLRHKVPRPMAAYRIPRAKKTLLFRPQRLRVAAIQHYHTVDHLLRIHTRLLVPPKLVPPKLAHPALVRPKLVLPALVPPKLVPPKLALVSILTYRPEKSEKAFHIACHAKELDEYVPKGSPVPIARNLTLSVFGTRR
ncbi:L-lactate dehydrogenase [Fonsecaea nubica]|uniref:L-lactate dehydrogenase n=1 Tax=Fonsecaea nubica TaxID=856822 RepID=A0A178D011_9EURO|nr:L-lactate dehydrogenase [Fonsecaea nubica]OAL35438.1 L-lactate dehydrogenase [Fonsecaea nubica]